MNPCKKCAEERMKGSTLCFEHTMKREDDRKRKSMEKQLAKPKNKPRAKKKPKKTTVKNRLDTLFSKLIRSAGKCCRCGATDEYNQLHCSHIYSRSFLSVRWDELNAKPLCANCHRWWHENPVESREWLVESGVRTLEQLYELKARKDKYKKFTVDDYLEIEQRLKEKLCPK